MNSTAHSRKLAAVLSREVRSYSLRELVTVTSPRAVRFAVKNGLLVRLFHGIYVAGEHRESFAARAHAAARWAGAGGAITGESALFIWGLLDEPPDQIQVALRKRSGRSVPLWVRPSYVTAALPTDEWMATDVVRAENALLHCYWRLPQSERYVLLHAGVSRGVISIQVLTDALNGASRVRARGALERGVAAISAGNVDHPETAVGETVFVAPELKSLLRKHKLTIRGEVHLLDFYDPSTRTAIELDGSSYYGERHARARDIARDAVLAAHGIQTLRFGYRDVTGEPQWCRETVAAALHARG